MLTFAAFRLKGEVKGFRKGLERKRLAQTGPLRESAELAGCALFVGAGEITRGIAVLIG